MTELLGLPYSPWSEKAKWALDVRRVPYSYRTYAPILDEPALRMRLRRWRGPVGVPVLTDDDGRAVSDSTEIARWADGQGEGPVLFPAAHRDDVERFVRLSEEGLAAGRVLSLHRVLKDDEALLEMVPRGLRGLGPLAIAIAAGGVKRTLRKWGRSDRVDPTAAEASLVRVLDELRSALAASRDKRTLFGELSFADIAIAQVLAFVEPPPSGLRIGPANRRCFTDPGIKERYADLVAWRDALYDAHRAVPRTD
jgi:glutathione S-transferase